MVISQYLTNVHMAKQQQGEIITGQVIEALPNTMFRIVLPEDAEVAGMKIDETHGKLMIAYLSGKMKLYRIKVMIGDTVDVVIDPYGGKGRIVKRK